MRFRLIRYLQCKANYKSIKKKREFAIGSSHGVFIWMGFSPTPKRGKLILISASKPRTKVAATKLKKKRSHLSWHVTLKTSLGNNLPKSTGKGIGGNASRKIPCFEFLKVETFEAVAKGASRGSSSGRLADRLLTFGPRGCKFRPGLQFIIRLH